jgi:hypothetical protein
MLKVSGELENIITDLTYAKEMCEVTLKQNLIPTHAYTFLYVRAICIKLTCCYDIFQHILIVYLHFCVLHAYILVGKVRVSLWNVALAKHFVFSLVPLSCVHQTHRFLYKVSCTTGWNILWCLNQKVVTLAVWWIIRNFCISYKWCFLYMWHNCSRTAKCFSLVHPLWGVQCHCRERRKGIFHSRNYAWK